MCYRPTASLIFDDEWPGLGPDVGVCSICHAIARLRREISERTLSQTNEQWIVWHILDALQEAERADPRIGYRLP